MKYIIANWKANKNISEVEEWKTGFSDLLKNDATLKSNLLDNKICLIICPPFPFISTLKSIEQLAPNIYVGAQTVSSFKEGAYTGEITAKSLQYLVSYAIIGHSERRSNFNETNETMAERVANAKECDIEPILCIRGTDDVVVPGTKLIAYEPVEAIGTGKNMPAEEVAEKKKSFVLPQDVVFIYGGSVNEASAASYLNNSEIHGLLIGGASLKPDTFVAIAKQA